MKFLLGILGLTLPLLGQAVQTPAPAKDAGNPQSAGEAAKFFMRSAEAGNDVGQMRLGRAYSLGLGVPKDARLAQRWLSLAAAQGNADAIFFLKQVYGVDVKQPAH